MQYYSITTYTKRYECYNYWFSIFTFKFSPKCGPCRWGDLSITCGHSTPTMWFLSAVCTSAPVRRSAVNRGHLGHSYVIIDISDVFMMRKKRFSFKFLYDKEYTKWLIGIFCKNKKYKRKIYPLLPSFPSQRMERGDKWRKERDNKKNSSLREKK